MIAHTIAYNGPHQSISARLPNESPMHLPMYVVCTVGSMMCAVCVCSFYALVVLNYGACAFIENDGCSEAAHGLKNAFAAVFTFPKRSQLYDQLGYVIAYFILFVIFTVGNYQLWSPHQQENKMWIKGLKREDEVVYGDNVGSEIPENNTKFQNQSRVVRRLYY